MADNQQPASRIANPFITRRLRLPQVVEPEPAEPTLRLPIVAVPRLAPAVARLCANALLLVVALALIAGTVYTERLQNRGVVRGPDLTPIPYTDVNPLGANVFLEKEVDRAVVDQSLQMLADANFKWIRQTFPWSDIEIHGKGDFEDRRHPDDVKSAWEKYDYIVDRANAHGLQILARIDAPPNWSRPGANIAAFPKGPPANQQDFADFVGAVAGRYKGKVQFFQLWNEPNLIGEWGGPANAREYTALLKAGYEGAKAANPDAVVVMASLAQTTEHVAYAGNESELNFLQEMYDAGAKPYFDVASVMIYGLGYGPDQRTTDLRLPGDDNRINFSRAILSREIMERNGDAGKPMWASEYAWISIPDDWQGKPSTWGDSVDEQTQGAYLVQGYQRAQAEWPWIGPMFVWHFRDQLEDDCNAELLAANALECEPARWFSLVDFDFEPRPAFAALREYGARFPEAATGAYLSSSPAVTWSANGGSIKFNGTRLDLIADPTAGLTGIIGALDGAAPPGWNVSATVQAALAISSNAEQVVAWPAPTGASPQRVTVAKDLPGGEHRFDFNIQRDPGAAGVMPTNLILGFVVSSEEPQPWRWPLAYGLAGLVLVWSAGRFSLGLARLPGIVRANVTRPGLGGEKSAALMAGVAMALMLLLYYFVPVAPLALLALLLWFALAVWRPSMALVATAAVIPFYWVPRLLPMPFSLNGGNGAVASLPLSETCLWLTLAAWIVHRLLRLNQRSPGANNVRRGGLISRRPAPVAQDVTGYLDLYQELQGPATLRDRIAAWLQRDLFGLPAVLWLLVGSLSLVTVATPDYLKDSLRAYRWVIVEPVLFYFLATDIMRGRRQAMRLLDGFAIGMTVAAFFALIDPNALPVEGVGRIQGVFPHPNNLAIMLGRALTLVGVTAIFLPSLAERARKRWYILAALVMLPAFLLTYSRGAYIAIAVALAATFLLRRPRLGLIVAGLGVAAGGAVILAAAAGLLPERIMAAGSGVIRIDLWTSALQMLADHPIFGVGLDQFYNLYRDFYRSEAAQGTRWLSHPHNLLLDCWLSLGIIGMLVGAWIVVRFWRGAVTLSRRSDPLVVAVALGAFAMLVDLFVHGMVDNSIFLQDLALTFWLACALLQLMRRSV